MSSFKTFPIITPLKKPNKLKIYPVVSFHPDTLSWRDRAMDRGGIIEDIDLVKLDPFVKKIYQLGLRDSVGENHIIIELIPVMGANLEASLTRLWMHPNAIPTINQGFVESNYDRTKGLTSGLTTTLLSGVQPLQHLDFNSLSIGLYNESSKPSESNEITSDDSFNGDNRLLIHSHFSDGNIYFDVGNAFGGRVVAATGGNSSGLIIGSKLSATQSGIYRRGVQIGSSTTEGGTLPNKKLTYFDCSSSDSSFTKTFCMVYVGKGIPENKHAAFNEAVHNLMVSLGRAF